MDSSEKPKVQVVTAGGVIKSNSGSNGGGDANRSANSRSSKRRGTRGRGGKKGGSKNDPNADDTKGKSTPQKPVSNGQTRGSPPPAAGSDADNEATPQQEVKGLVTVPPSAPPLQASASDPPSFNKSRENTPPRHRPSGALDLEPSHVDGGNSADLPNQGGGEYRDQFSEYGQDEKQPTRGNAGAGTSKSQAKLRVNVEKLYDSPSVENGKSSEVFWLFVCFLGIMASFVIYGLLLEYTTSGGRKLHELSFLFVTSSLYTITAAAGRYVRAETPTTIPPARFAVLGLTSMGSTFCSVRSLRYVIYPIQVLAKSCKPVPVMIFGALMGKRYPMRKYINVVLIVLGVALFMGGGDSKGKKGPDTEEQSSASQIMGIVLLFISLCFDGGTGAYEDKLMSVYSVQPFDLMYNIQLGKTILAGVSLLVLNQVHIFLQMCQEMGFLLVALGLSGAMGQVFIFVTIAKFGALTCSIIGLARKVTTLVASIYFYGHHLNGVQFSGLSLAVAAMVLNFMGKGKKGSSGSHGGGGHAADHSKESIRPLPKLTEEMQSMLNNPEGQWEDEEAAGENGNGDIELATSSNK